MYIPIALPIMKILQIKKSFIAYFFSIIAFLLIFFNLSSFADNKDRPILVMETNQGIIEIELFTDLAPKTCENMIGLSNKGYYNGLTFHRVIKNFMIQGGDPEGTGAGGQSLWGNDFEDEFVENLTFDKPGLLAMANRGPNTNGSQFFITTVPTPHLNNRHTIFGEVIKGFDVLKKIENTPTDPLTNRPLEPPIIVNISVK